MVSTRTTAQSQRQVQRLDCSVPGLCHCDWLSWLLVVHILRPLGVALVLYWKQRACRGQGAAVAGEPGQYRCTVKAIETGTDPDSHSPLIINAHGSSHHLLTTATPSAASPTILRVGTVL